MYKPDEFEEVRTALTDVMKKAGIDDTPANTFQFLLDRVRGNLHVVLGVEKLRQKADATINLSGTTLHADAEHEDMYAAIDALSDKLDRQIIKYKEKLKDHKRKDARIMEAAE